MKSTINKIIDVEAALVQKSTELLTKIHDLSYTEEDPINKKLSDILALFESTQGGSSNDSESGDTEEPEVETTINSFTITGASRSAVNGTYTKTSDTSSKTGRDAQYSMKSGDDEYLCYYNTRLKEWDIKRSGLEVMYYATTTADNPWEVTTWLNAFNDEVDSSIKVVADSGL